MLRFLFLPAPASRDSYSISLYSSTSTNRRKRQGLYLSERRRALRIQWNNQLNWRSRCTQAALATERRQASNVANQASLMSPKYGLRCVTQKNEVHLSCSGCNKDLTDDVAAASTMVSVKL